MATCVLCQRVHRVRSLTRLVKSFTRAQHMPVTPGDDATAQEENKKRLQYQETSFVGGYRLLYNPSSYHRSGCPSFPCSTQMDHDDDEQCLVPYTPSFWQQSNRYSVSCSRHLSSSKNTLLDLAFNKVSKPELCSVLPYHRNPVPPDVKVDPRAFLKCRPEYASMTLDLTQRPQLIEWSDVLPLLQKVSFLKGRLKPSDVSEFFMELSKLNPDKMTLLRSDQRFLILLRYCVEHQRLFTLHQLLEVLRSFVWLEMPSSHAVLEGFETELSRRVNQMSLHESLLVADLWRCLGRKVPRFLQLLYDSLQLCLGQVGIPELVQFLYIVGEGRHCPKDMIRPIEQLLMRCLPQLHPEEVGTICLALFKSQTALSVGTVTRLVDTALLFVAEMSDFAIVNVLKYLRFSYLFHRSWLEAMTFEVPRRAHRMGIQGLMHVVLTCSALHYRSDSILMAVAKRIPLLAPHCRSKDSCKLLWAFGTLGFLPIQSPDLYSSLAESLRHRKAEFQRYPEHLLTGLLGLAFVSYFPEDLVSLALSPEFVDLALKNTQLELKKDLFTLDGTVELELPQWTGPRLSKKLKVEVADILWKFAQSDLCQKPEVLEAESGLQDLLGGEKFVCKRMILPHTRSIDLEVHLDSNGEPIPVDPPCPKQNIASAQSNPGWEKLNSGVVITDELLTQLINSKHATNIRSSPIEAPRQRLPPDKSGRLFDSVLDLTSDLIETLTKPTTRVATCQDSKSPVKVAIQITNRNHYCSQSQQLLGLHALKRRHLKMSGYKVVELSHWEWSPMLRKSRSEKLAYLHCKIYDSL